MSFLLFAFVLLKYANSEINFCYNGIHTITNNDSPVHIRRFVHHCPYGVLFKHPKTIHALESDTNGFCFKDSICSETKENWTCGLRKQSVQAQLITSKGTNSQSGLKDFFFNDESITHINPHCVHSVSKSDPSSFSSSNQDDENKLRRKRETINLDDDNLTHDTIRSELKAQTKRMFYFLAGINPENVDSDLRSVALFKKSAEVIRGSCDPMYLNSGFVDSIVKAFLFILKEQGTEKIQDTALEHYESLMQTLHNCTSGNGYTLKLLAPTTSRQKKSCSSADITMIHRQDKDGKIETLPYVPDIDTFRWGKYDVIVDAAWHIVDFVHGICFNSFAATINSYHHYQVAMEQLFKNMVQVRWSFPTQLARNSLYDNILLAPVNETFKILDACVHGAYINSPFDRRLDRPVEKENLAREFRKKRSIVSENEDYGNVLADTAYCLQTEKELDDRIAELRTTQCKNMRNYIDT